MNRGDFGVGHRGGSDRAREVEGRAAHLTAGSPRMQRCPAIDAPRPSGRARRDGARSRRRGAASLAGAAVRDSPAAAHVVRAWPAGRPAPPLDVVDLAGKPLAPRGARRPGRRPQFLGDLVRAVPRSRCRRSTRWRHGAAATASSSPRSTTRRRPTSIRRFLERAPFKSQILLDSRRRRDRRLDAARLPEHRAHRPQRRAGAGRRRRARLGRRRGQGAARSARRRAGPRLGAAPAHGKLLAPRTARRRGARR